MVDVAANLPPNIRSHANVIVLLHLLLVIYSVRGLRELTIDFCPLSSGLRLCLLRTVIDPGDYS